MQCGYPCLSIDHLKMGLIRSGDTDLTPEDDGALAERPWPIVREMAKTAIETRLEDSGCTLSELEEDSCRCIDAFAKCN